MPFSLEESEGHDLLKQNVNWPREGELLSSVTIELPESGAKRNVERETRVVGYPISLLSVSTKKTFRYR